jgi:membrane protease YdiL (CAAX protease family)
MKVDHLCMNMKAIAGYIAVLTLSVLLYSIKPSNMIFYNSLPALMIIFPVIVGYKVKIRFSIKDLLIGLIVSVVIIVPYSLVFGSSIKSITAYSLIFQLLSVALPEEFFFRGFLQDSMGRSLKVVLMVSLMFSLAHLPKAVFLGDWLSLLSFFPSLVMGWLYKKTNNIVPGTIFHLLANLAYQTGSL